VANEASGRWGPIFVVNYAFIGHLFHVIICILFSRIGAFRIDPERPVGEYKERGAFSHAFDDVVASAPVHVTHLRFSPFFFNTS
jgi:hypothetical protein